MRRGLRPAARARGAATVVVGFTFALGCAGVGGSPKPDWVEGASSAHPSARWISASASGSSVEAARGNARAELARIFHSRVESEVRDRAESTVVSDAEGRSRSSVVEKLEVDTRIQTEGSFEGVRVAEVWEDPRSDLWHALAVVNKADLRTALASQIQESSRHVSGDLAGAGAAPTSLGRARALLDGIRSSRARDVLVAQARVAGAPRDDFRPTTAELSKQLDTVLQETRFQVRALEVDSSTGSAREGLPRLREAFEKRITGLGFRVVGAGKTRAESDLVLTCNMTLEEVPRDFPGHFVRWEGSYELAGAAPDPVVVLSSQASGGESYSTLSVARTRAIATGAQQLADDLQMQISRYLEGRDDH